jgi:DNA-binding NarL/FixJ family response regulator
VSLEQPSEAFTSKIKVLIVDDQQIIQQGLAVILSYQPGLVVVGTAANGRDALEQCLLKRPDVVLMDVRMPIMDGVEATVQLRQQLPATRVLILTTFDDEEYAIAALKAGASGYLLKDIPGEELAGAIRAVYHGIYQLDPNVGSKLIMGLSSSQASTPTSPPLQTTPSPTSPTERRLDLSERELEILRLVARGATNREIAETLVITEGTVKNHVSNILSRLGLRDRTQAAIFARDQGLL